MTKNVYRIDRECLNIPCVDMAQYLLGKKLVRKIDDVVLAGRIVETESYLGGEDKASHSYGGRRTPRNEPMFMPVGTTYVYITYGIYHCFNISSLEPGAAVLVRALQPLEGLEVMGKFRMDKRRGKIAKTDKLRLELCNGPSKLCMSMNIDKSNCNMLDLCESDQMWIEFDPEFDNNFETIKTARIGVKSAGEEWASKALRYYIFRNPYVSKRDRTAEKLLN